jgi:hypothetical protein
MKEKTWFQKVKSDLRHFKAMAREYKNDSPDIQLVFWEYIVAFAQVEVDKMRRELDGTKK